MFEMENQCYKPGCTQAGLHEFEMVFWCAYHHQENIRKATVQRIGKTDDKQCRLCGTIWLLNAETGICAMCEAEYLLDEPEAEPMHAADWEDDYD